MFVCCRCRFHLLRRGADSASLNPLAVLKRPLRGIGKRRGKGKKGWEKRPLSEMKFWLESCFPAAAVEVNWRSAGAALTNAVPRGGGY